MTADTEPQPRSRFRVWSGRVYLSLKAFLLFVFKFLVGAWATLALYYSNLPWYWGRVFMALAFAAFAIWALWVTPRRSMRWVFAGLFTVVLFWFISIEPQQDRDWRPLVAIPPRAIVEGDLVRITGFRNFDFTGRDEYTVKYEEREVYLSDLTSVDLFISYWMPGPVGHTFVSFNFKNAPPVCISIEARLANGEHYQPIASMFKQFELFYMVGDERDAIRWRTNFRDEDVYMYPIITSPERARNLFLVYMMRINELADRPEFYHLLSDSCTVNIIRYANAAGRVGQFDYRHLLNGLIDRYLYSVGLVNRSLPFAELRHRSRITDVSKAAPNDEHYSETIRKALP